MSTDNRFSILGLTGPLGSGCTSTAKFLSNQESTDILDGVSLSDFIIDKFGNKSNKNVNNKIKIYYENIKKYKRQIQIRQEKYKGLYKDFLADNRYEKYVKERNDELTKIHKRLKVYLRRREINDVLIKFTKDSCFKNSNLNFNDFKIFGLKPFAYISFSKIIVKLAIESFFVDYGRENLQKFFSKKIHETDKQEEKVVYEKIKNQCIFIFNERASKWKKFKDANTFIKDREYVVKFKFKKDERRKNFFDFLNIYCKNAINHYYEYLFWIDEVLKELKKPIDGCCHDIYTKLFSEILQDWGDNLRFSGNAFGGNEIEALYCVSEEINSIIKFLRHRIRFLDKEFNIILDNNNFSKKPTLFIIECFRNPFEVEFFRSRYAEFYLISLYADENVRKNRLKYYSEERDKRDQGKKKSAFDLYKLDVRSCVLMSDISILNNRGNLERNKRNYQLEQFFEKLIQFIALIRKPGCITPTPDELYMQLAYSLSLMSNCLSRKVGALVVGKNGYIFGAGWNDVSEGQISCGLRHKNDYLNFQEFFPIAPKKETAIFIETINEYEGKYICYKDIFSEIRTQKTIDKKHLLPDQNNLKKDTKFNIKRLEFCRALHAEENALLQTTKSGGMPVVGGTLYTTTFPCELCAKKIYQTGITIICYNEPYPESISDEVLLNDGIRNIERRPFEGVKSNSFYKLYKSIPDKKEQDLINSQ